MNILFIASMPITKLDDRGIFPDMVRAFARGGHTVYAVSACERREKQPTSMTKDGNTYVLQVRTLNNRRVSFLEKAFAVITTPLLFNRAIKKYLEDFTIELIIFSTPPVTIYPLIARLKKRLKVPVYLILKDIWPQAMVDLQVIKKGSILWKVFDRMAKKLYSICEYIGTMSEGNSNLLSELYVGLTKEKIEVCPNSVELMSVEEINSYDQIDFRDKNEIPDNALLLLYGGSFNKPQGIPFLLEVLDSFCNDSHVYFILCGAGTDYHLVEEWYMKKQPKNVKIFPYLSKEDYFSLLRNSDVGLVFLDSRFTVPNIPSRVLDYIQFSLPIIASVDRYTDFRDIIEKGGFGLGSLTSDLGGFRRNVESLMDNEYRNAMGSAGRCYLEQHWTADNACNGILAHFVVNDK